MRNDPLVLTKAVAGIHARQRQMLYSLKTSIGAQLRGAALCDPERADRGFSVQPDALPMDVMPDMFCSLAVFDDDTTWGDIGLMDMKDISTRAGYGPDIEVHARADPPGARMYGNVTYVRRFGRIIDPGARAAVRLRALDKALDQQHRNGLLRNGGAVTVDGQGVVRQVTDTTGGLTAPKRHVLNHIKSFGDISTKIPARGEICEPQKFASRCSR